MSDCAYYQVIPARWDSAGGSPEERWCTHPDTGSGDCNEDDCPLERPLTAEDVREWADEDKFEREYVDHGSRY